MSQFCLTSSPKNMLGISFSKFPLELERSRFGGLHCCTVAVACIQALTGTIPFGNTIKHWQKKFYTDLGQNKEELKKLLQDYLKIDTKNPITYPAPYCYSFLIDKTHFYKFPVEMKITEINALLQKNANPIKNWKKIIFLSFFSTHPTNLSKLTISIACLISTKHQLFN